MSSAKAGQGATAVEVTADAVVYALPCRLVGVTLNHTATTTAILYDNATTASGTKSAQIRCAANDQAELWFGDEGVEMANGIYADWTAGVMTVYYKK